MKPIEPKNPSKVIIVPHPQNPTQKSETVNPEEVKTESDQKEEAQEETPEQPKE